MSNRIALMIVLFATLAFAEDAPAPREHVVIVEADRIKTAWRAVVEAAAAAGYHAIRRRKGVTLFRADEAWKPDLLIHDDGRLDFQRQPPSVVTPKELLLDVPASLMAQQILSEGGPRGEADAELLAHAHTSGMGAAVRLPNGQMGTLKLVSIDGWVAEPKKLKALESDLQDQLAPTLAALVDARSALASNVRVNNIPDELDLIWRGPGSVEARHAALFSWWDLRTETPEGDAAREAGRAYLIGVVQASDTPFSQAELSALNAHRFGLVALELPGAR